jgi:hypothetical protein
MFRYTLFVVAAIILLTPVPLWCGDVTDVKGVPTMRELVPATAYPGTVVLVKGEYLDRVHVAEVYMTRGTVDTKVRVIAQSAEELKFKVPEEIENGRYGITVLTASKVPMLLEQPVWVNVKREIDTK